MNLSNKSQDDALNRILDTMREHFESGVIILEAEGSTENSNITVALYHGGYVNAVGLTHIARHQFLNDRPEE